jgi:hypothetical protein
MLFFSDIIFNYKSKEKLLRPGNVFCIVFKQPKKIQHVRRPLMTFKQFYYIVLKKRGVRFPLKKNKYRRF